LRALLLQAVGEFRDQALAVGGAVVDHGHAFGAHVLDGVAAQRPAELDVVGDHPEGGVETLLRVFRAGARRRNLRDAGLVIDLRRRNRGARGLMADTPFTRASTSFWATLVACFGSPPSSSATSSKRTFLPRSWRRAH
jgi:hypothetical protein